ncbi:MAG: heavy-metal-associated domain-containing protein [Pseudomonadota bacterium]
MEMLALEIGGMECGGCAASIEKLLYGVKGVQSAAVSFAAAEAEIIFDPAQTDAAALEQAVLDAGYVAKQTKPASSAV